MASAEKKEEPTTEKKPPPVQQPKLTVSEPSGSTTVDRQTYTVKGKVTPADVDVSVNGSSLSPDDDGTFLDVVSLDFGKNTIRVVAKNGSKQDEVSRTITRESPPEEEEQPQEQERQQESERQEPEPQEPENPTVGIGQPVRVGDAEWMVTNAQYAQQLTSDFGDTKTGNFVIVDFTFTNRANEAVTLDTISLPMVDSQGREYEADTDTFGYIDPAKNIFFTQVNPGVTQQAQIIYSVAPNASGFTIHAGDLEFFGTDEANIRLGF